MTLKTFVCTLFLALLSLSAVAQPAVNLPPQQGYLGEIRRSPEGKLIVVPKAELPVINPQLAKVTMVVGSGEKITTITEAARLARDGEVIEIRPGIYRGQPAVWLQNNLVIRGSGERPVMEGDGKSAEDKAIWVIRGGAVHIENIEFRGARVSNGIGAGIRFERGSLTIESCRFTDNEMGILTTNFP